MSNTILIVAVAFLLSYIAIFTIKPLAIKFGLVDTPCTRKQHDGLVPLIGGLCIFLSVLLSIVIFLPLDKKIVSYLICAGAVVLLGVADDYRPLGVKIRLSVQSILALILIWGSDIYIQSLGNLFQFGEINLGLLGIPFTVIAVLAAINAFNMIDGIDGLAGSLSITTLVSVFILMGLNGYVSLVTLPIIIVATIVPFLAFNLGLKGHKNKKIFMGDAGSMFIGLSVIWFLMHATQGQSNDIAFRPVTALWIIALPLMDMLAIIIRRARKGLSPFVADRDHLHHIFMRIGFSPRKSLVIIVLFSVLMSSIGILGELFLVPESVMLALYIAFFIAYSASLQHCWKIVSYLRRNK